MTDRAMPAPAAHSFRFKLAGALLLVILADLFFFMQRAGATLGLFALALLVLACCQRLEMLRRWPSRLALAAAMGFAIVLAIDPGLLAFGLFWIALTFAVLAPRTAAFDDGWRWATRLLVHTVLIHFGPFRDWLIARRARTRRGRPGMLGAAPALILPVVGSLVFLGLFAQANPVIEAALAGVDWPRVDGTSLQRIGFWAAVLIGVWSLLRPPRIALRPAGPGGDWDFELPGVTIASVTLSLIAFNALFALQNGLDIAFLWSGARLPDGMTLAEYAHRGAYPLIATAVLAGLFVLITLRPGTSTAASRPIRLLVTLWIAQNIALVLFTMLRTFDYIEAYSLTRLRIAALIWMALVAIGLALICYRLLRDKSGAWLINANLLAALVVLAAGSTVDLGRMAAAWNVRHAREVGGRGAALDLCYLNQLGPSALLPLIELEGRSLPAELRDRVAWLRTRKLAELEASQADWHGWTWRGARRLAAAHALVEARRQPRHRGGERQCNGRPFPPPQPMRAVEAPQPLTAPAKR